VELTRLVLNVVWVVLAGFWMALAYLIAGLLCCLLIVTIPFGVAAFRIAGYAFWPFGRTAVARPDAGPASLVGNVVWFLVAGWWLALAFGIPLALANFKLIPISLAPLGEQIVWIEPPSY
jgi:uncharacterized membrane protein YccF (DUF307 family)